MNAQHASIAIFHDHAAAEAAVRALKHAGVDFENISIAGRQIENVEQPIGFFNLGERVRFLGGQGAFWGSLAGILFGSVMMFIPVFGHLIVLGPLGAAIVSGLEGAAIGGAAGALAGALSAIGVPKDSVIRYEDAIKANKYVVTVQGTAEEAALAHQVLSSTGAERVDSFDADGSDGSAAKAADPAAA